MKRRTRVLRLALAALLLVGIGATFAAIEDSTSTADNRVTSNAIAQQVDLQITPHSAALPSTTNCNTVDPSTYVQNQDQGAAAELVVIDGEPGNTSRQFVCLKNAGSGTADLDLATLFDVADLDIACTGNETPDDATCGAGGTGELTSEVVVDIGVNDNIGGSNNNCDGNPARRFLFGDPAGTPANAVAIAEGATDTPAVNINDLAPGATICLTVDLTYSQANTTVAEENVNQSDELTFKVRFRATEV